MNDFVPSTPSVPVVAVVSWHRCRTMTPITVVVLLLLRGSLERCDGFSPVKQGPFHPSRHSSALGAIRSTESVGFTHTVLRRQGRTEVFTGSSSSSSASSSAATSASVVTTATTIHPGTGATLPVDATAAAAALSTTSGVLQAMALAQEAETMGRYDPFKETSTSREHRQAFLYQSDQHRHTTASTNTRGGFLPIWQLAVIGALTTLVADIATHPVDCIKTLQQSDVAWELGLVDDFPKAVEYLWTTCGLPGFFRGFLTYSITDAMAGALKFATWESWKQRMVDCHPQQQQHQQDLVKQYALLWVGAGLAFMASSIFLVPGEFVKQQLQMGCYSGFPEAVTGIWQSQGLSGFFTGYDAVCYRDVPYTMMELGLYEMFKRFTINENHAKHQQQQEQQQQLLLQEDFDNNKAPTPTAIVSDPPAWQELMAASATGAVAAFLTQPFDTIKTKIMVDTGAAEAGFWTCFHHTMDVHGFWALFSGVEARVACIVPFLCIYLPLYDTLKRLLEKQQAESRQNGSGMIFEDSRPLTLLSTRETSSTLIPHALQTVDI